MAVMIGDLGEAGPIKRKFASVVMRVLPGQLSCQDFNDLVCDYAEGRLKPSQSRRFQFHLSICPMCRSHLSAYERTIELSKGASSDDKLEKLMNPPEHLIEAIVKARKEPPDPNEDAETPNVVDRDDD